MLAQIKSAIQNNIKLISFSILAFLLSIMVIFTAGELYVRSLCHTDDDGNYFFQHRRLLPYKLPAKTVERKLKEIGGQPNFFVMYDPDLGWTMRPDSISEDGLYITDSNGIRFSSPSRTLDITPTPGKLRIALLGDSYTYAYDEPYEQTWGYLLENKLNQMGIAAEVLNFGVPAYGIDQIYLRWKKLAKQFKPDIVILGFYYDDACRNGIVFMPIRVPETGFLFTKPRYVIQDDSMKLINSPTMPVSEIPNFIANFESSPLAEYEEFYYKPDYEKRFLDNSKFISYLKWELIDDRYDLKNRSRNTNGDGAPKCFDVDTEPVKIALNLLETLNNEVRAQGAQLIIIHFTYRRQLKELLSGKQLAYKELLSQLDGKYVLLRPENEMLEFAKSESVDLLFNNHYSLKGNQIISDKIAAYILSHR